MRGFLFVALCGFAALAAAQPTVQKSDWELEQEQRNWKEAAVRLPAYPKDAGLEQDQIVAVDQFGLVDVAEDRFDLR